MKKGLENILYQTKKFLATSLAAVALYTPAQETIKIDVNSDGSWAKTAKTTLYFQSTTGAQGRDLTKNDLNKFETQVYFYGRKTDNGNVEFAYMTTDLENPQINASVPHNEKTKIYFFGDSDTTAEIISQTNILMNARGKISFEDSVPKEKASCLLMKLGENMLKNLEEKDPTKAIVEKYSLGLLSIGATDAIRYYCENKTVSIGRKAKENTGYELSINNIPLQTLDKNMAGTKKEVGRITKLKFLSKSATQVPVAILLHLELKRNGEGNTFRVGSENESGTIEAYTSAFITSARNSSSIENCSTETAKSSNPFDGVWMRKKGSGFPTLIITKEGAVYPVELFSERNSNKKWMYQLNLVTNEGWVAKRYYITPENKIIPEEERGHENITRDLSMAGENIYTMLRGNMAHYVPITKQGETLAHPEWLNDPFIKSMREATDKLNEQPEIKQTPIEQPKKPLSNTNSSKTPYRRSIPEGNLKVIQKLFGR